MCTFFLHLVNYDNWRKWNLTNQYMLRPWIWAYWSVLADSVQLADTERLSSTLLSLLQIIQTPPLDKLDPSFHIVIHFMSPKCPRFAQLLAAQL